MVQLIAVLASFTAVPILGKFKVSLGVSLIVSAVVMALLNGLGLIKIFKIFTGVFTSASSMNTILVVAAISVVGTMMKEYGVLNKAITALSELVSDKRILLIIVPAVIGTLTIPGGAILSAPFVFGLGEEMNLTKERRAAANLIFRHMAVFLVPYSSSLMVAMSLTDFTAGELISANVCFAVSMIMAGYVLILRKAPSCKGDGQKQKHTLFYLKQALIYASPIYICVIIHIATGWPLYICLIASLVILYLLGPKKGYFQLFFKSLGLKTVISIVGVYMIQGVVSQLDGLNAIFQNIFNLGIFTLPALAFTSLFFGVITGLHMSALGIVLPMLLGLSLGKGELLAFVYFVFCWSFLGYYFSPLHMCQIFTCEYMGVKIKDLYKEYIPFMVFISVCIILTYLGLSYILPLIYG